MLNPLHLAADLLTGIACAIAIFAAIRLTDVRRRLQRYEEGLRRIARMQVHAQAGSVYATEAEWARAAAKAALYPPSLRGVASRDETP